jgi:alpha-L-rhamnosidase
VDCTLQLLSILAMVTRMAPQVSKLTFARNASSIGIGQQRPTLSWRYDQSDKTTNDWTQTAFELSFERDGKTSKRTINSENNVDVPWPEQEPPLRSREIVKVGVRAQGKDLNWTEWYYKTVEAGLLDPKDWSAKVVAPKVGGPPNLAKRPFYVAKTFKLGSASGPQRVYATALGVYELSINGKRVGDHVMAPGWQSYNHRLHYQTYEIPEGVLVSGENTIEALVGEGWYSGRLTWLENCRNIWGSEIGVQVQVEVGGKPVVVTDTDWQWRYGPLLASELYDGEVYDATIGYSDWQPTKTISLPAETALIAPEAPPIRRTEEVVPKALSTSPSGKKIIDFGQNLVGWVKIRQIPKQSRPNECIVLRFAEVLTKDGEMGIRPLRSAKVTDRIYLGDKAVHDWEPTFTTHGFRYCEVTGPPALLEKYQENLVAVVVHSDMERIGDFECSHELVNQLHRNVVWGLRGNFVGLPTDCPQRDERWAW